MKAQDRDTSSSESTQAHLSKINYVEKHGLSLGEKRVTSGRINQGGPCLGKLKCVAHNIQLVKIISKIMEIIEKYEII